MSETMLIVVAVAAIAVMGAITMMIDGGVSENAKRWIRYSLYGLCAVLVGVFFVLDDRSEFVHTPWESANKAKKKRKGGGSGDDGGNDPRDMVGDEGGGGGGGEGGGDGSGGALPAAAQRFKTVFDCAVCPEMIILPARTVAAIEDGKAGDGKAATTSDAPKKGRPQATAIGRFEITYEQFKKFVDETKVELSNRCDRGPHGGVTEGVTFLKPGFKTGGHNPAICVTSDEVVRYTMWLSKKANKTYRLPTEDEWEYAARANQRGPFLAGGTITTGQANFAGLGLIRDSGPKNAASYQANNFGLHDAYGNVSEMVSNCAVTKASGPEGDCKFRMIKGGSWADSDKALMFGWRGSVAYEVGSTTVGFRVVRE